MTTESKTTRAERFAYRLYALDNGARAELKRALLQEDPSLYPPIFRYVEPYAPESSGARKAYYLVASLFGSTEREHESEGDPPRLQFAGAVRRYEFQSKGEGGDDISSIEKRFLALLDADIDELPYRLRQIIKMITSGQYRVSQPLDWASLTDDLIRWNSPYRTSQTKWAKQFYQPVPKQTEQGDQS
jgi:CRISPR system Cascade subunit CasB